MAALLCLCAWSNFWSNHTHLSPKATIYSTISFLVVQIKRFFVDLFCTKALSLKLSQKCIHRRKCYMVAIRKRKYTAKNLLNVVVEDVWTNDTTSPKFAVILCACIATWWTLCGLALSHILLIKLNSSTNMHHY